MTETTKHGTVSGYSNGCHCDECKAAGRLYRTEGTLTAFLDGKTKTLPLFRPENRTEPYDPLDPRHGTLSAYTRGCRCPWCREAGKAYRAHKKLGLKLPKHFNSKNEELPE